MLNSKNLTQMNAQQGVGLIEVLVATLVLTIGILGMVGMQTRALQFSQESLQTSQALMLAYEMTDRIRANKTTAASYGVLYGESVTAPNNCATTSCSPSQIALYELNEWKTAVAQNLPAGDAQIVRDTAGTRPFFTITVRFQDTRLGNALNGGQGADSLREVSVRTEI